MVNKVKPKQSITANAVPESLERGELAINVTDRKLYSSDGNTVFELTGGSSNSGGSGNATPGGSNTSIQFNDSGSLGGNASFTYNKSTNTISVGNSTVNSTINSTFFSQTANNALTANVANSSLFANYSYFANVANTVSNITNTQIIAALGYVPADSANGLGYVPVNKAGDSMTGQLNVGSNVQLTLSSLIIGNSTINTTVNSSMFRIGTANVWTTASLSNVSQLSNDAGYITNVNTSLGYNPANRAGDTFTGTVNVGANVIISLSGLSIGNSTVNTTVNSSMFRIGTANVWTTATLINVSQLSNDSGYITNVNTSLGYTPANRAGDTFTGTVNIGANVVLTTSSMTIGNSTVNTTQNSTMFAINGSNVWTQTTLTNLNQLTNGPGYITNVNTSLGYTPANRAGDTFTGAVAINKSFDGANLATMALRTLGSFGGGITLQDTGYMGMYVYSSGQEFQIAFSNTTSANISANALYINSSGFVRPQTALIVGSNVSLNTSTLLIGNSTVNTTINSTGFAIFNGSTSYFLSNTTAIATDPVRNAILGQIYTTGSSAAYWINRRDTNAASWAIYSSDGALRFYDSVNGTDRFVFSNTGLLSIGNTTQNAWINSSGFYVNGVSITGGGSLYALKAGDTFTGTVNVGSNVNISTAGIAIGNSTANITANSTQLNVGANLTINATTISPRLNSSYVTNTSGITPLFYGIANTSNPDIFLEAQGTNAPRFFFRYAGGSASPAPPTSGVNLGAINFAAYRADTNAISTATQIIGITTEAHTNTAMGAGIRIRVNPTGATATANVISFFGNGQVWVENTSGQIWFGNSTVNTTVNSSIISIGNTANLTATALNIGANVALTTGILSIGNSTVNTVINATGVSILGSGGSLGVGTTQSGTTGEIRATGNIAGYFSDMRLKKDIVVIPEAIEKVKNISGVYYRTNDIAKSYGYQDDKTLQVGVLAQEIQKQFPQLVQIAPFDSDFSDGTLKSKSGENYLTVNMLGLIPVLIESIKELSDKVDNLENELNKYKNNTN